MNTLLSYALTIGVLMLIARTVKASGFALFTILFSLYFGVSFLNTIDEAVLFQVLTWPVGFRALAVGLLIASTICFGVTLLFKRAKPPDTFLARGLQWRVFAASAAYVVLYLIAGFLVFPYIKDFYADRVMPSLGSLVLIQLFRGILYVGMAIPFLSHMPGRRLAAGLILGLCFSILGGIAPLLLNNQFMPLNIRLAHSFEVGISNFLFALIVASLLVGAPESSFEVDRVRPRTRGL